MIQNRNIGMDTHVDFIELKNTIACVDVEINGTI